MNGKNRKDIEIGSEVEIVLKQDQRTGELTHGFVKKILTKSKFHPHGIKVELETREVGRVQNIMSNKCDEIVVKSNNVRCIPQVILRFSDMPILSLRFSRTRCAS